MFPQLFPRCPCAAPGTSAPSPVLSHSLRGLAVSIAETLTLMLSVLTPLRSFGHCTSFARLGSYGSHNRCALSSRCSRADFTLPRSAAQGWRSLRTTTIWSADLLRTCVRIGHQPGQSHRGCPPDWVTHLGVCVGWRMGISLLGTRDPPKWGCDYHVRYSIIGQGRKDTTRLSSACERKRGPVPSFSFIQHKE